MFNSMQMWMRNCRVFLCVTAGYACLGLVIYLWISEGSRLTVRVQTEDEFLLLNKKETFHPTSPAYNRKQYHHLPCKLSTPKERANGLRISETQGETRHRTFLQTRTRCTQKYLLLILVPSSPLNFKKRRVIRQTWGTDYSMNKNWRTMFLLGQPRHPTEMKYLSAETAIYGDIIQGSQTDSYHNLTLKTEMGLEWAVKCCDFDFLLKADDDVFVNTFKLLDYLRNPVTRKIKLYLGNVARRSKTHREGKWALSYDEYQSEILPRFCLGPAYVLSIDLVRQFVDKFDPKKPLKLEDVYVGMLAERVGVTPRRHRGFRTNKSGQCSKYYNLIVIHEASSDCIIKLFNKALEERFRQEMKRS